MAKIPPEDLVPEDDLTAYLDGELDDEESRAIEAKLALDPKARSQADALKKSFDLLDYLPKPEPRADFTTRTLTKIQPAIGASSLTQSRLPGSSTLTLSPMEAPRSWRALVICAIAAMVALVGGFVVHRAVRPMVLASSQVPTDLAKDYRMLNHLPFYLGVDDLEFLKALNSTNLFDPDPHTPINHRELTGESGVNTDKWIELFQSYPESRQQQLRKLDADFHALPAEEKGHLQSVLENYAVWLDQLPDGERKEILNAPNSTARLDVVTQVHQKRWRESLPDPSREKLNATAGVTERLELVRTWLDADRKRSEEWQVARRQWSEVLGAERKAPWPFSDAGLAKEVDDYVKTVFKADLSMKFEPKTDLPASCRLSRQEFLELRNVHDLATKEGKGTWFLYGLAIYRASEKHPYLPEAPPGKTQVVSISTLPTEFTKLERQKQILNRAETVRKSTNGKWPEFALAVSEEIKFFKLPVPESFGPCRPGDFTEPMNKFLSETLLPKLSTADRDNLKKLEGKWPDYPKAVVQLAKSKPYNVPVPGVSLPGLPSLWAKYYGLASTGKD